LRDVEDALSEAKRGNGLPFVSVTAANGRGLSIAADKVLYVEALREPTHPEA
jgi:hypothetical protein